MARVEFSERWISSPKRVPQSGRVEYRDSLFPGLVLRVGDTGHRSLVLVTKSPGGRNAVRRSLGQYGELTVEDAREMAREWVKLIKRGIDPKQQAAETHAKAVEADRTKALTFSRVADEYLTEHVAKLKQPSNYQRLMAEDFMPRFGNRVVTEITAKRLPKSYARSRRSVENPKRTMRWH